MDAPATPPAIPNVTSGKELPEKYIRTFAGDMETVQKGGTPDLTPLDVPQSGTSGEHSAPQNILAAQLPPPPPPVAAVPKEQGPTPLQTYAGDFTERMKKMNASTATVLAAEQDAATRAPRPEVTQASPRNNLPYVITGAVLVIAGITGAYFAYTHYLSGSEPVILAPVAATPIFVDEREEISGTDRELLQAIKQSVGRPLATGTVRLLSIASANSTSSPQATSVFSALPLSAPGVLLRNINAKDSMVGVLNISGNQSTFFILSVSSYSNTFSGMLQWEPVMPLALAELFPSSTEVPKVQTASSTSATTSPKVAPTTPQAPAHIAGFYDMTIANHDVRVYRDTTGRDVLLYGYWNQTTLVIARDPAAFVELVGRLATARAQ